MVRLTENDFRVFVTIDRRQLKQGAVRIAGRNNLSRKDIEKSADTLKILGFVDIDETGVWTVTGEGREYLDRQSDFLQDYYDELDSAALS